MRRPRLVPSIAMLLALMPFAVAAEPCSGERVQIQVLGSGAGGLGEGRAAPSVLVWIDGKPRLMIDAGPGAAMRFVRANATFQNLDHSPRHANHFVNTLCHRLETIS